MSCAEHYHGTREILNVALIFQFLFNILKEMTTCNQNLPDKKNFKSFKAKEN